MRSKVEEKFLEFYEKWVYQLEQYLHQLTIAQELTNPNGDDDDDDDKNNNELRALISKLTTHHKEYYMVKWAAAGEDVLAFFGPAWLSPLENAYFWLTGWKPSTAFRLLEALRKARRPPQLTELAEAQVRKLEELRGRIRLEEEKVEREMERHQVALADRKIVELARLAGHVARGGSNDAPVVERVEVLVVAAVKGLAAGLEKGMKTADCVRLKTLKGILDILTPRQCIGFLAGSSALQIQLRRWGRERHDIDS